MNSIRQFCIFIEKKKCLWTDLISVRHRNSNPYIHAVVSSVQPRSRCRTLLSQSSHVALVYPPSTSTTLNRPTKITIFYLIIFYCCTRAVRTHINFRAGLRCRSATAASTHTPTANKRRHDRAALKDEACVLLRPNRKEKKISLKQQVDSSRINTIYIFSE